jgi:hypothetical protein
MVWINDQLVTDFTDTANHAANGATDGMLAIQMHVTNEQTNRWADAGFWRWRAIAVKELDRLWYFPQWSVSPNRDRVDVLRYCVSGLDHLFLLC